MLKLIYDFYRCANEALNKDVDFEDIMSLPAREKIGRVKYIPESEIGQLDLVDEEIIKGLKELVSGDK